MASRLRTRFARTVTDPVRSARRAGLRYINETPVGLRRRRAGRGFVYLDAAGRRIRDARTLRRIRALAIPPAWRDVWICPVANGHIQAVGTDAAGRRQYRYHDHWRILRDRAKHDQVLLVARRLPQARAEVAEHIRLPGYPRERVLGAAFQLLDLGFFRVGGEQYADENGSYGLATIRREHVSIEGGAVVFDYPAKNGKQRIQQLRGLRRCFGPRIGDVLVEHAEHVCRDLPRVEIRLGVDRGDLQLPLVHLLPGERGEAVPRRLPRRAGADRYPL